LNTIEELYISKKYMLRLPVFFPRLTLIGMSAADYDRNDRNRPYALIDLLINRAAGLKVLKIHPARGPILSLRIYQLLSNHLNLNLPSISLENQFLITPSSSIIQRLLEFNLTFTQIRIRIKQSEYMHNLGTNEVEAETRTRTMLRTVSSWLKTQEISLTDLSIDFCLQPHLTSFPFPLLPVLNNLSIIFPYEKLVSLPNNTQPDLPFLDNPFPALKKVRLFQYRKDCPIFGSSSMPSVQEIHMDRPQTSWTDPSWRFKFPNLTSLYIVLESDLELNYPTLKFILTHLYQLIDLSVELTTSKMFAYPGPMAHCCDHWDVFTGGAHSILQKLVLDDDFSEKVGDLREPVKGIYQVPSLGNMRGMYRTILISSHQ